MSCANCLAALMVAVAPLFLASISLDALEQKHQQ